MGVGLLASAEQALRNALLKIDARNMAMRRRVYESAWNAHERALLADRSLKDRDRSIRRDALMQLIRSIESEYNAVSPENENQGSDASLTSNGPEEQINVELNGTSKLSSPVPHHRAAARKRSKIFLIVLPAVLAIIMICVFTAWSFFNSLSGRSIVEPRSEITKQQTVAEPKLPVRTEPSKDEGWVNVYYPGDATTVKTQGQASLKILNDADIPYLQIFANKMQDAAIVDIGAGAISDFRGKKIMLDINIRSDGQQPSQMSITCDLGKGRNCGRRRFEVPVNRSDILLDIDVPADETGPAKLFITSDLLGEGHAINIYNIRLKAAE